MRKGLQVLLSVGGVAAVLIALLHLLLGPASIPGSIPVNATMDSEDRFYATIFLGFGLALLWCVGEIEKKSRCVYFLSAIFFAGGIARLVSVLRVGWPHPFFVAMTGLELCLPLLIVFLQSRISIANPTRA